MASEDLPFYDQHEVCVQMPLPEVNQTAREISQVHGLSDVGLVVCCMNSVNPDQCQHEGATVQFTVMDHDVVFQNDFAGEVFLAMADVPGVDGREIARFDALPTINLPLLQLKQKSHSALDILSRRMWDKDAQDFVKKRIKVEEQAISSTS